MTMIHRCMLSINSSEWISMHMKDNTYYFIYANRWKTHYKDLIHLRIYTSLTWCLLFWVKEVFQQPCLPPSNQDSISAGDLQETSIRLQGASINKSLRSLYNQAKCDLQFNSNFSSSSVQPAENKQTKKNKELVKYNFPNVVRFNLGLICVTACSHLRQDHWKRKIIKEQFWKDCWLTFIESTFVLLVWF